MTEGQSGLSRRSILRGVAGVAAAAALPGLAACNSSGSTPAAAPSASAAPKKGGRMRAAFIGGSNESGNILQNTNTAIDYVRTRVLFDSLVEIDTAGKPSYVLAESIEPNADGTQWTVRLRNGPRFTNGKPVTADDVLHTLRTHVSNKSSVAPLLMDIDLANAKKQDDRTVILPTRRPHGFLDLMLSQGIFIFSKDTTDLNKAIGSGPFTLAQYKAGQGALLKRNPDYWRSDVGGPYLDELELLTITDADARMNALKAGQIDYAGSISLTAARAERDNQALQLIIPPKWEWANFGAAMKRNKAPFKDPRVAQALRLAVDREVMVRNVTLGFGEVGNDLLGKHLPYYLDDLPQRQYDPERAKSLLAEAGMSDLKLTLRTSDYEYGLLEGAAAFAEHARKAGITINLDKVPAADFFADPKVFVGAPFQSANRKPRPLPLDVMFFYGSDALLPFTGVANPQVDGLTARLRTAVNDEQRRAAVGDLHRYLYEEGGDLVWARAPIVSAGTPKVHNVQSLGYPSFPSFRDAFLA
ncbi:ABC transporter substrate-binding protein [Micromonospora sp. AMSO1212t]|uniref:ABC transporter substrate-binding protein n=1 Tax=Micromonospora sp. AMSO1212t TaxID=2650565 RepID=UPI00124B8556|nr:ABC transporter substrate-binding protein [Micromonospora sp. AMSO1212t]KAB1910350.1 ABC transporter substrate-binding protein [Micromonospora sp. AMSO1212t]